MELFDALGFDWDRSQVSDAISVHAVERACFRFKRSLAEFVWDASRLEGNPFTFPEVITLLDGISVGGHKLSDQEQVLNLASSCKRLATLVQSGQFSMTKPTFLELHSIVARNEALEWGVFRGEGSETNFSPNVALGDLGSYTPLPTIAGAPALNQAFDRGVDALHTCPPLERGLAFFLFGALQQFFFDGNKRTSRLMMNGVLMSNGIDAISVPASRALDFNEKMVRFYRSKDATEMMGFLVDCHPDIKSAPSNLIESKRSPDDPTGP